VDIYAIPRNEIAALIIALAARLHEPETPTAPPTIVPQVDGAALWRGRQDDEWLTAPEAAKFLRCSTEKLYRKAGQMSCCRRNGRTLSFSKAGLAKWLTRQKA
jgi:hypothetical protein